MAASASLLLLILLLYMSSISEAFQNFLFFLCLVTATLGTEVCATSGRVPCLNAMCPGPGERCLKTQFDDSQVCCPPSDVITVSPEKCTLGRESGPCFNGYCLSTDERCVDNAQICCALSDIITVTGQKCALGRELGPCMGDMCPGSFICVADQGVCCSPADIIASPNACEDKTGIFNCALMASYCNNPTYYSALAEECPKTCGQCGVVNLGK